AAVEANFLLLLSIIRIKWIFAALRSIRRQPYVAFALLYTILFVVAFSSFANFGILVRERIQLYPLFFVLLSIPPPARRPHTGGEAIVSNSDVGGELRASR